MRLFVSKKRTVAVIGLPGHGKTVFLTSLFGDSFFNLATPLKPYNVCALTEEAMKVFHDNAILLYDRKTLPAKNPRIKPQPAVLEFTGVPYPGNPRKCRTIQLTFYDIAGEVFRTEADTREYAPFLTKSDDIIFLFDPTAPDFSALSAARLVDLVYRVVGRDKRKNIIIALSKMDELRMQSEWADDINQYWPGTPPDHSDLGAYLKEMDSISGMVRDWWSSPAKQAGGLINSLPETTHFCAISSLGHQPVTDEKGTLRLEGDPDPFRVRDPLFWVFHAAGLMYVPRVSRPR